MKIPAKKAAKAVSKTTSNARKAYKKAIAAAKPAKKLLA